MFGFGIPELLVIGIIALVVFGPKKLPELGKSIGRAMAEFKKAQQEFQNSVQAEMKEVEKPAELDKIKKLGKVELNSYGESGTHEPAWEQGPKQMAWQSQDPDHKQVTEAMKNG